MKGMKKMNENNLALEICKDYKKTCRYVFILAMTILVFWIITIVSFLYYLSLYDFGNTSNQDVDNIENSNIKQNIE